MSHTTTNTWTLINNYKPNEKSWGSSKLVHSMEFSCHRKTEGRETQKFCHPNSEGYCNQVGFICKPKHRQLDTVLCVLERLKQTEETIFHQNSSTLTHHCPWISYTLMNSLPPSLLEPSTVIVAYMNRYMKWKMMWVLLISDYQLWLARLPLLPVSVCC